MKPRAPRLFATAEDASEFIEHVAQKRPYVHTLPAEALREPRLSLSDLSAHGLIARGGRHGSLTRFEHPRERRPSGSAAEWAAGWYRKGETIEIEGLRMPIRGFVGRLAGDLHSAVQKHQWSLLVLPAGVRTPDARESEAPQGDLFYVHLRGGLLTARSKRKAYELPVNSLGYVPEGTKLVLEATEESVLLRLQIMFKPAWMILLNALAANLCDDPDLDVPAVGLLGSGRAATVARERVARALDAAKARLESRSADTVVQDYREFVKSEKPEREAPRDERQGQGQTQGQPQAQEDQGPPPLPPEGPLSQVMFPNAQWGVTGVARRADDIHIVTFKRSGTTWMQMIMYQLLTSGDLDKIQHMYEFSPYPDYELRILGKTDRLDSLPSPRVIKSHLPFDKIYSPVGRYIYVARNGMDVGVSAFHHHRGVGNGPVPFEGYIDEYMTEARWFREVGGWWAKRELPNVLFLTFQDLKKDLAGTVAKIAKFCDVTLTDEKLARVVEQSSFKNMKLHEAKFDHNWGIHWLLQQAEINFIRHGQVSEGKATFNEAQQRRFKDLYRRHLGHTDLRLDE